jgi:hypothetical protein
MKSNKGAVEMSLNLIIMLVIGLTVLGLIIAFVTGFLGQAEDSLLGSLTPDDTTKLEQVKRESGNFVISPSNLNVQRGEDAKLYIKVENPTSESQNNVFLGGTVQETGNFRYTVTSSGTADITVESPPINLQASEIQAIPTIVTIGESTTTGNYFLSFSITIGSDSSGNPNTYTQVVTVVVE